MEKGNKIALILGIVAIVASVFVILESSSFQKKAILTKGKVVYVLGSSYKIQYFTDEGTEKIYQGSWKNNKYHEGNSVSAWYKISNPERVRFSDRKKEAKTLLTSGLIGILLGIYPLFQKKKVNSATS